MVNMMITWNGVGIGRTKWHFSEIHGHRATVCNYFAFVIWEMSVKPIKLQKYIRIGEQILAT